MRRILTSAGLVACVSAVALGQGVNVEVNGERVFFRDARPQTGLAPICRKRSGSITAETAWLHDAEK